MRRDSARTFSAFMFVLTIAACAGTDLSAEERARYGKVCEKQGHAPHTDAWRACIETEDLNAGLARRKDYEQRALKRLECIDPKLPCAPDVR